MQAHPLVVVGAGRLGRWVAARLDVPLVHHLDPLPKADCVWLTVPDSAIASMAAGLPPGLPAVHSAGSLGASVLGNRPSAVLHPLMTFPAPAGVRIPATLDGDRELVTQMEDVAARLGWELLGEVDDRVAYHAACCLASGHLAAAFCDAARVLAAATGLSEAEARIQLGPLALASVQRASEHGPAAITGPAARGDDLTILAHRAALPAEVLPFYDVGTERIRALRRR